MLQVDALGFSIAGDPLLENLTFNIGMGETFAILGPSGSGKTTLLRLLLGVETPATGKVAWSNEALSLANHLLVPPERRHFGLVFQDAALFPHLTVLGNIAFGLHHLPFEERRTQALTWLERVGLSGFAKRNVQSLSGGERQKVALARALAPGPRLLLLDEPFSSVDRLARQQLIGLLRTLLSSMQCAVALVTHDARDAVDLATHLLILRQGKAVQQGDLADVLAHPVNEWVSHFLSLGLQEGKPMPNATPRHTSKEADAMPE